jgi:splicing factor 3B subunit 3
MLNSFAVPGGNEGPGGVLVCAENWITWKNQTYTDVRVPIPRRSNDETTRGLIINSFVVHKMKVGFFFELD